MEIKVKANKNLHKDQENTFAGMLVLLSSIDLGTQVNEANQKIQNPIIKAELELTLMTIRRSKDLALWDAVQVQVIEKTVGQKTADRFFGELFFTIIILLPMRV